MVTGALIFLVGLVIGTFLKPKDKTIWAEYKHWNRKAKIVELDTNIDLGNES